jgi:hypothetical protein
MFLLVLSSMAISWAIDLNAPAEKKITIGSEIERGMSAILDAKLKTRATDILGCLTAIDEVFDRNKQANVDTQAFILGASLSAWLGLDIILNLAAENPNSPFFPPKEVHLAQDNAKNYFNEFRKIQKEINMDDETLAKASGIKYELLKAKIYRWDKKFK